MKYILILLFLISLPAYANDRIKIGVILPLTGQWAEFGEAQKNALELAKSQNLVLSNRAIFIYEDGQYNSGTLLSAFHKLRTQDKVDLFYVWGAEPSLVASKLADQFQVPMLLSAQLSKTQNESKYLLRTINYAEQYSEKLVEYFNSKNFKRIGIIKTEISFYNDRINGMKELLKPDQKLEVLYELNPTETDLKSIVTSLKTKDFDILGLYLTPPQIISFYKSSKEQKLNGLTFGSTPFESRRLISMTNQAIVGSFYEHNDTSKEFHEQYLDKFKKDDQIAWAANAFDVANLIAEISQDGQVVDGMHMLELLRKSSPKQGAGGNFNVEYKPGVGYYFNYPVVIKSVLENSFKVIFR